MKPSSRGAHYGTIKVFACGRLLSRLGLELPEVRIINIPAEIRSSTVLKLILRRESVDWI